MVLDFGDQILKDIVAFVLLSLDLLGLGEASCSVMRTLNPVESPTWKGN